MQVENYQLQASNGKNVRTATKVVLANGQEITFTERLTKKQAIRSAFQEVGRLAFENGESSAPVLNPLVQEAIKDLRVGTGAKLVMKAYAEGWHRANLAAGVL
jgi:hypothetical protein